MADKNLHDIKIDELDSPKKTPLKNILTLLALLFIILVISVVITRLILNTNDGKEIEGNSSSLMPSTELVADTNKTDEVNNTVKVPVLSTAIPERNLTSVTKEALRTHTPAKELKEIKTPKTYTAPKKTHTTAPKKEYIDKVVTKKPTTIKKTNSAKYLGGKLLPASNSYYIKVGTYRDTTAVVNKVKKNNFNYSLVKLKDDKTMTRVLVGPFFSHNEAQKNLSKVKANILAGAYITKVN